MKDSLEGWENHNKNLRDLGLPETTKDTYLASLQRVSLGEHEDAVHASLRNRPKSNNDEAK